MRAASPRCDASPPTSGAADRRVRPRVVHAHDWQAALAPAYLHYDDGPRPGTAVTIHNIAFQGHYPASIFGELGLPPRALAIDGVEYFGGVGYLKAGLQLSDRITTVSPTYAREIMTPEFGNALDGLFGRAPRLCKASSTESTVRSGIGDRPRAGAELQRAAHRHACA